MSTIVELYAAIKGAKKRPKGVAVSTDLYATLKKAGVIEMKTGFASGLFKTTDKFPAFQGDIFVVINPALDGEPKTFLMPADYAEVRVGAQERRRAADRRKTPRRAEKKDENEK
jgi:hypothetical protein